jgi:DNA/RNA endonuclease YhcR with UshA esterase domain
MSRTAGLIAAVLCFLSGSIFADGPAQTQPVPTSQPVAVDLADQDALTADMGKLVIVEGVVSSAQWSPSGRVFLIRFKEGRQTRFQAAFFDEQRDTMQQAFNTDLSAAFTGAQLQIVGKLQKYHEHPEILIQSPKQITILTKPPPLPATNPATTQPSPPQENERQ